MPVLEYRLPQHSFTLVAALLVQPQRSGIVGIDVGIDSVQSPLVKTISQYQLKCFATETLSPVVHIPYQDVRLCRAVDIVQVGQIDIANVEVVVSQANSQLNVGRMEDGVLYPFLLSCLRDKYLPPPNWLVISGLLRHLIVVL